MAGLTDSTAVASGSFILQLLKEIQNTGGNWYLATQEWQEFPRQVQQLQKKLEFWETGCTNRGISQNAALIESLQHMKSLLEEEVQNLNKRAESCWAGCWPRLHMTLFPARLGQSIQSLINAFNNIPEMLRSNEEAGATLDRLVQEEPFSDPISPDSRYVILQKSEKEVCEALDNPGGPAVILLHGGPGKGKTTLAHNMAVHYNKSNQPVFNHVFFLACGPQARADDTQFELIQRLGFEPSASLQDDEKIRSIRIRRQVKALLSAQKVLIILDDVSDGKFLECIVELCGEKVKFLVTSQEATLCRALDRSKVHRIQIQDLDMKGAKEILASHVGLPDRQIPAHVQEVAEAMIHKTDLNPLALASLANGIGYDRSSELVEWEEASSNLLKALDSEVPAVFHGMYPRSFWSTTKLSMDKLAEDSRRLLLLIHACEGPLIPEEVVKVLFRGLTPQGDPGSFSSIARDELVNRHLVMITTVESRLSWTRKANLHKQRNWSVHSLHRLYIEKEMAQERDHIISSLMNSDRSKEGQMDSECEIVSESKEVINSTVLTTLCALYLDNPLASMAGKKLCIPPKILSNIRRNAIEPVTRLLGQPLSPRWTEMHRSCVAKVFTSYICNGTLDDSSISHLLGEEIAAPAMCEVLKDIAIIEETCVLNENTRGLMEVLVSWLTKGLETSKPHAALSVLVAFTYNTSHGLFMISFPGVLEGILGSLHNTSEFDVQNYGSNRFSSEDAIMELHRQELVGMALANLACGECEIKYKIVHHSEVLSELANSLSKDVNPRLQEEVARAVRNLAYTGNLEIKYKIVNHSGVLSELANSLSKDFNPRLQEQVVRALSNLANNGGMEIANKIVNHPRILSELAKSLSKDINPRLQEQVVTALADLACGGLETKDKIVNHPGLLSELVVLLSKDINPDFQEETARALTNLACGDPNTQNKIVNHPGVLSELVHSLSKDINPSFEEEVAKALANLASGGPETKDKIVNHPGLLSKLVESLANCKDISGTFQRHVAETLVNLTYGGLDTRDKIVNHPGVLSMLVNLLSKDHTSAYLWTHRVKPDPRMDNKVRHNRPQLALKTLTMRTKESFQEMATQTLANLAKEEGNIMRIKATKGMVEGLVDFLSQTTQWYAAFVLTLIDPRHVNEEHLQSASNHEGRTFANYHLELFKEALVDFNKGRELGFDGGLWDDVWVSTVLKAKVGDYQGAMVDANEALNTYKEEDNVYGRGFLLQERGTLKRMMGDLHGALADLNEGLAIDTDDYEILKQRGYVKFRLGDEEGARADAELALRVKPSSIDDVNYGQTIQCLGTSSVEYLGYRLR